MRMSRLLGTVAAGALLLGAPAASANDSGLPISLSGYVAFTTDYVFRGISVSNESPAIQGSLTASSDSGFFAGLWGSNVDFGMGGDESVEIDYSVGFSNSVDKLNYTVGAYYYTFPGVASGLDYDYLELGLNMSYGAGLITPTASLYYSPDFFLGTGTAWYLSGGLSLAPTDILTFYGNVGIQTVEEYDEDIFDWNLGVSAKLNVMTFDVKYTDTDIENTDGAEERIVFSVTAGF